ncbi:DUF2513 domain-containing protein [Defluviimonas denitrificans]|uniref:DUF2513 domain-containing protein n=1 Tax=Albidovulum denitrificans TaxID=404881 RepID=UPI0011B0359E|nr:DUF2513 domain-containing protein [Defluviimonas denitrificans]
MKRDLDLVRSMLIKAEDSDERYFDIGVWEWTDHDMRDRELDTKLGQAELFHLDLMEQGGLIKKSVCENSDIVMWEITWYGYDFLDASRSEKLWNRLKREAKAQGISLTVSGAISAVRALSAELLSVGAAQ